MVLTRLSCHHVTLPGALILHKWTLVQHISSRAVVGSRCPEQEHYKPGPKVSPTPTVLVLGYPEEELTNP
jgi:hypothetical protein